MFKVHLACAVTCSSESTNLYNSRILQLRSASQLAITLYESRQEEFYLNMDLHFLRILLLILQCRITYFAGSANSVSPVPASVHSVSGIQNLSNHTECPMWFNYSSATNDCQCFQFESLKCDNYKHVSIDPDLILTYNSDKGLISSIQIRHQYLGGYNLTETGYVLLPDEISELNSYMCGPLNRKGYLCGECKNGYGPGPFIKSCTNVCHFCQDTWHEIILYLALEFIPITIFYLLILIFQIRLTSAPMTCFITYSQLIMLAFYMDCASQWAPSFFSKIKYGYYSGTLRMGTKSLLTVYGVFNLDFFHYVLPPFCISSKLRPIHVVFLGYISAFYPFLLILLTWFCVELHGRNFRPIVFLWRPFHRCFARLRRGWNTKSDLIDVFASFFLLSYSKILYQIILTMDVTTIYNYSLVDGHGSQEHVHVLKVDTSIDTKSTRYLVIHSIIVLFCLSFVSFPPCLLLLYPVGIFQRFLSKCISNRFRIILHIFVEKFQSCYRDGPYSAKGIRSFSGFYFLLRFAVYLAPSINSSTFHFEIWLTCGFVLSVAALLIALCRPYKETTMNVVDSIFLTHLATLCYIASSNNEGQIHVNFFQTVIAFPFIIFSLTIAYRIVRGICNNHKVHFLKWLFQWRFFKACDHDGLITADNVDQQQDINSQPKATYGTISDLP